MDSEILFDQIQKMIEIIHNAGGFVFLVLTDNLRANQKTFKLFYAKFGSQDIFAINHPVPNSVFSKLYLLYDPTHQHTEQLGHREDGNVRFRRTVYKECSTHEMVGLRSYL